MEIVEINGDFFIRDFPLDIEEISKLPKKYYLEAYCADCGILLKRNKYVYLKALKNGKSYCKKCSAKFVDNTIKREKYKQTCLEKYGVENTFQVDAFKDKAKQTCLERYNTEFAQCNKQIKDKIAQTIKQRTDEDIQSANQKRKQTCLEKYGVENINQLEDTKLKTKKTCLSKYGRDNTVTLPQVKEGLKSKFGVDNISKTEYWKESVIKTSKEKYNVEWFTKAPEIKEKQKDTCMKHFGVPYYGQSEQFKNNIADRIFEWQIEALRKRDLSVYNTSFFVENDTIMLSCLNCKKSWPLNKVGQSSKYFVCSDCYPNGFYNGRSSYEDLIISFIDDDVIRNDRKVLNGKEIDILYKDIGFEINGVYWHSLKDKYYHLNKTETALQRDIRLVHLSDWLIDNKPDVIKYYIKNLLNKDIIKVYARECEIKEISSKDYSTFCELYHIQGATSAKIRIGLFYKGELVQIMSFSKPRFNKNYDYELIREVSKSTYRIIGGKERLLKYFERNYKPASLISYCDRRWFTGQSYVRLGFNLKGTTVPSYSYYKEGICLSRYQCQKHNLPKLLDTFDESLSEYQNMINNKYLRMFDCGQLVFVKTYRNTIAD